MYFNLLGLIGERRGKSSLNYYNMRLDNYTLYATFNANPKYYMEGEDPGTIVTSQVRFKITKPKSCRNLYPEYILLINEVEVDIKKREYERIKNTCTYVIQEYPNSPFLDHAFILQYLTINRKKTDRATEFYNWARAATDKYNNHYFFGVWLYHHYTEAIIEVNRKTKASKEIANNQIANYRYLKINYPQSLGYNYMRFLKYKTEYTRRSKRDIHN